MHVILYSVPHALDYSNRTCLYAGDPFGYVCKGIRRKVLRDLHQLND